MKIVCMFTAELWGLAGLTEATEVLLRVLESLFLLLVNVSPFFHITWYLERILLLHAP